VTAPQLNPDDQIATLVVVRDEAEAEAFYYRRRGVDQHDRHHAIQLEDWARALDAVVSNLRMARRADPVP